MINCVLVDDEPGNNRILKKLLEEFCPDAAVVGEASHANEAEEMIQRTHPDLVFLDIEMAYGNGFDLLDRLMPVKFEVIFVTAFNEYTLKAFKYSALDYLLKPVNIEELCMAVRRAMEKVKLSNSGRQLKVLLENLRETEPGASKLAIPTLEGLSFIRIDTIISCEASKGYTIFSIHNGEKIMSSRNIKEYEALLPANMFLRVHNSYIINLKRVEKYHKGRGGYIEMEDHSLIELATRRKSEFLNIFGY
jgi:two-component system LytT family response regulator